MDSVEWDSLPRRVREAVEQHTGVVARASGAGDGASTDMRLILDSPGGKVFIKGTGPDSSWVERERLALGAALAPYVSPLSPLPLWQVRAGGWDVSGWPVLPGRPADFRSGPDVGLVLGLLRGLAEIPAPDVPGLESTGEFWGIPGDMLVHTDPQPANFIVGGGRAWMIDWGWAMRGPSWLTPARLVPHLLIAGWNPADAEQVFSAIPAWTGAPSGKVTAYALSHADSWEEIHQKRPGNQHCRLWRDVTRAWAEHRTGRG